MCTLKKKVIITTMSECLAQNKHVVTNCAKLLLSSFPFSLPSVVHPCPRPAIYVSTGRRCYKLSDFPIKGPYPPTAQ